MLLLLLQRNLLWLGAEIEESHKSDCLMEWFSYVLGLLCSNLAQREVTESRITRSAQSIPKP